MASDSLDVWTIPGERGNLTFLLYGDVVMLHTADDQPTVYVDELMARSSEGRPTQMTQEQALEAALFMVGQLSGQLQQAPPIAPDSWLQDATFADFRRGYSYASAKSHAIPGLARVTPEQAYYIWRFIQRGVSMPAGDNSPDVGEQNEQ